MEECEEEERREGRGGTITPPPPPYPDIKEFALGPPPVIKECESPRRGGQNHDFRSYAYDAVPISRNFTFSQKVLFPQGKLKSLERAGAKGGPC